MPAEIVKMPGSSLVKVGDRDLATGGWSSPAVLEHLKNHIADSTIWCSTECMARVMYGRNSPSNVERVRERMPTARRDLMAKGHLVIVRYSGGSYGTQVAYCLLTEAADEDVKARFSMMIGRMRSMGEASAEWIDRAEQLGFGFLHPEV